MARCAPWSSTPPGARCVLLLTLAEREPGPGEALVAVHACGVCRTDLHILDGEVGSSRCPLIPGHQIVGTVLATGAGAELEPGARVGVPVARMDVRRVPVLHERPREPVRARRGSPASTSTAATRRGPSPTRATASRCPSGYGDLAAAPLLCAGLIGHRALRMCGDAERLGLYGFGAVGPHRLPGRAPPGPARVRLHARRATRRRRRSRSSSAASGRATRWARRRRSSTPRSSSPRSARSSRPRCGRSRPAGSSSAPGST